MVARLIEPKIIAGFNQELVCLLPKGSWFDDDCRQKAWIAFGEKGATLNLAEKREIFPDGAVLQEENLKVRRVDKKTST